MNEEKMSNIRIPEVSIYIEREALTEKHKLAYKNAMGKDYDGYLLEPHKVEEMYIWTYDYMLKVAMLDDGYQCYVDIPLENVLACLTKVPKDALDKHIDKIQDVIDNLEGVLK